MDLLTLFPIVNLSAAEMSALLPLLILTFGALATMLTSPLKHKGTQISFGLSLLTLILSAALTCCNLSQTPLQLQEGILVFDEYTRLGHLTLLLMGALGILNIFGAQKKFLPEIYSLTLFAVAGMMLFISSQHLVFLFIALEIFSLAIYVMIGLQRINRASAEACLKYFILGGVASALFLYGGAMMFGATGQMLLNKMMEELPQLNSSQLILLSIGGVVLTCGLLFKVGAAPFHFWVPDVYQGAATPVTGFMGSAVKFSAFMVMVRVFLPLAPVYLTEGSYLHLILSFSAALSMLWGNFGALGQNSLKRLFSYSAIAHSGYLLLGVISLQEATGPQAKEVLLLYLAFYGLANLGTFGILTMLEEKSGEEVNFNTISGLALQSPCTAVMLSIFTLAMAGIPLTSGFMGKYLLFQTAMKSGETGLSVIAMLTSVVSVYYYLKVLVFMFMREQTTQKVVSGISSSCTAGTCAAHWSSLLTGVISVFFTLLFGIFPQVVLRLVSLVLNRPY